MALAIDLFRSSRDTMEKFVLVVDDNEEARIAAEISLQPLDTCAIYSFKTVAKALTFLETDAHGLGVLVTDLHLPQADGFELIQRVRSDVRWAHVPIVVVSADGCQETRDRLQDLGADAFFLKPYSPAQLLRTVERLLYANDQDSLASVHNRLGPGSPDHR